ncbi:hypothetical protein ACJIZ3_009064 [Penstemon smallii]|uniref:Uncharacterized protein n=1 Tax=Penstemon smallii TaxID=265156 RepID=A0ABD3TD67_9LAMI
MHQRYQSRRSSAAHRKIENEDEIEIEGSYFSNWTGSTKAEDEGGVCCSKNFQESIEGNMNEIRRMIADMTSKQSNYSDFSSRSVSNHRSSSYRESQDLFDTKSMRNNQVSIQSDSSKLYGKYKLYSAVELDDRRDRGLCLWCDAFWSIGHDCCNEKKFYVFDIDVDNAFEVNENDPIESRVDVTFILMKDCVENESTVLNKITCDVETENRESSEVLGKHYEEEKNELQVFDELPKQDLSQNIAERCKSYSLENMPEKCEINFQDYDNKRLGILYDVEPWCLVVSTTTNVMCLDDVCSGEWMAILITNPSSKDVGSLHKLHEMLEAQSWVVEWPEPHLPPPEPPPRLI